MIIFRPVPATDRPETFPVLPIEITVEDGDTVAHYENHASESFDTFMACVAAHQLTATELLGDALTDRIRALMREAGAAGDVALVGHCEAALDGESYGREKAASAIVDALLA